MNEIKQASVKIAEELVRRFTNRSELCQLLDITPAYLSLLLDGKRIISKNLCRKISALYPGDKELLDQCMQVQVLKAYVL